MAKSIAFGEERPLIMAHRGDPVAAPENSLLSMQKAVEVGVDFLETDVRMTKDNQNERKKAYLNTHIFQISRRC